jgi:hypothetical protein
VSAEESGCNTGVSAHAAAHHVIASRSVTEKIVTLAASRQRKDIYVRVEGE